MPHRAVAERLRDIVDAAGRIQDYARGLTYEQFCQDRRTIEAVQFNFIVIGEAARQIPDDVVNRHPEIPWREMRALRSIVVHGYFGVSLPVLWQTLAADVPPLVKPVQNLLREVEGSLNE